MSPRVLLLDLDSVKRRTHGRSHNEAVAAQQSEQRAQKEKNFVCL